MHFTRDDRAVSIAVTHVLSIGITAILISGLLIGASTMLETQREDSTEESLETIGERLADEIASVDRLAAAGAENVTIETTHQRSIAGSSYTVTMHTGGCDRPLVETDQCLVLESRGEDVEVAVPISTQVPLEDGSWASSGPIVIESDGTTISFGGDD